MWCPSDEFMNLQDVQDVKKAHEFVIDADGVSDDDREVAARSGVRRLGPGCLSPFSSGTADVVQSVSSDSPRKNRYGCTWCYKTEQIMPQSSRRCGRH